MENHIFETVESFMEALQNLPSIVRFHYDDRIYLRCRNRTYTLKRTKNHIAVLEYHLNSRMDIYFTFDDNQIVVCSEKFPPTPYSSLSSKNDDYYTKIEIDDLILNLKVEFNKYDIREISNQDLNKFGLKRIRKIKNIKGD